MDSDDDLFGCVIDMEMDMYNQGFKDGQIEGIKKSKAKSEAEGGTYGQQIGNHIGYYVTTLEIMKTGMPEKFGENSRLKKLYEKLVLKLSKVDIKECYGDHFEKDQKQIKQWFQQILSLVKVKSVSDNPQDEIAF